MDWRKWGRWGKAPVRAAGFIAGILLASLVGGQESGAQEPSREGVVLEIWEPAATGGGLRFDAAADLIAVVPRYESNPAYNLLNVGAGVGGIQAIDRKVEEFDFALAWTPRVTLGLSGAAGNQVRARWWHFDAPARPVNFVNSPLPAGGPALARSVSSMSPLLSISALNSFPAVTSVQAQGVPAGTDLLRFAYGLEFEIFDAEIALTPLEYANWTFQFTGALRYAHIGQSYDAFAVGNVPQFLIARQRYDGVGPVIGVEARRPLGFLGLTMQGVSRLGYLYGEHDFSMNGLTLGLIPPFAPTLNTDAAERRRFLPTFEFEGGVEGRYPLGRAELSFRAGLLVMGLPIGSGNSGNGNVGMVGFILGTGLHF